MAEAQLQIWLLINIGKKYKLGVFSSFCCYDDCCMDPNSILKMLPLAKKILLLLFFTVFSVVYGESKKEPLSDQSLGLKALSSKKISWIRAHQKIMGFTGLAVGSLLLYWMMSCKKGAACDADDVGVAPITLNNHSQSGNVNFVVQVEVSNNGDNTQNDNSQDSRQINGFPDAIVKNSNSIIPIRIEIDTDDQSIDEELPPLSDSDSTEEVDPAMIRHRDNMCQIFQNIFNSTDTLNDFIDAMKNFMKYASEDTKQRCLEYVCHELSQNMTRACPQF